jgi:hypothetical protein
LSICQLFRDNIPQSDSKCCSTILRIMQPQQTPHFSPHRETRCSTTLRGLSKRYKSGNGGAMRKTPSISSSAACCRRHHFSDPCCLQPPKPSPAGSRMAVAVFAMGGRQAVERTARISDQACRHGDMATTSDPAVGAGLGMRQYLKCIVHYLHS